MKKVLIIALAIIFFIISFDSYAKRYYSFSYYHKVTYKFEYKVSIKPYRKRSSRNSNNRNSFELGYPIRSYQKPSYTSEAFYERQNKQKKSEYDTWVNSFTYKMYPKNETELRLAEKELNKQIINFNKKYIGFANTQKWKNSQTFRFLNQWSDDFQIRTKNKFLYQLDKFILKKRNFVTKTKFYERYCKVNLEPRSLRSIEIDTEKSFNRKIKSPLDR